MPKFRKKPVEIVAVKLDAEDRSRTAENLLREMGVEPGFPDSNRSMPMWWRLLTNGEWRLVIATLEGEMVATHGDWIIRGVKGEFYPCKSDIFEATYEAA